MDELSKGEFMKAIKAFLFTLDGTHSPDAMVMAHYWDALNQFELEKVINALSLLASESTEHIRPSEVALKITGKKAVKAKTAFDEVIGLVRQHGISGARAHIDKESKTWAAVKQIGGLNALNTSDLGAARAAFYREFDR